MRRSPLFSCPSPCGQCGVLSQRIWLIDWSQTAGKACWARRYIAASVEEGATREEVRAFGRLAPVATQDAVGSLHQPQRTRHMLRVRTSSLRRDRGEAFFMQMTSPSAYKPAPTSYCP